MVLFVGLLIRQIWHHVPEGTCLHTHFLGDVQSHTRRHICCISYRKCSQLIMLILLWRTRRAFRDEADFVWGRKGGGAFLCPPNFSESCYDLLVFDFMFQLNALLVYYIFSYSSTCFEHHCVHHQEELLYTHSIWFFVSHSS